MKNNKKYWKGIEELTNDIEFVKNAEKEFPDFLPVSEQKGNKNEEGGNSRRDFLKLMGFGMAAVSLAACETPVKKAIPYLNKPENIDPSIPNFYASTYMKDGEYCSILVKTREGRPIKIEGNTMSNVTKGGTSSRVQASLLGLYDLSREQFKEGFLKGGKSIDIDKADAEIKRALQGARGTIYIVTPTIVSPSTKQVVKEFATKYPNTKHVTYEAISAYGILKANEESFGVFALPTYDFSKADTIVSVNADFLCTWLSTIEYSQQYGKTRKVSAQKRTMSRHYHFESGMSLSGANADHRVQIKPSQEGLVIGALYNEIVGGKQAPTIEDAKLVAKIKQAGEELKANRGKSLLVCGSNDPNVQVLVNAINDKLGNYDSTIDLTKPTHLKQGNDEEVNKMIDAIAGGRAGAVMFLDTNPVYDHPRGKELAEGLKKIPLSISFSNAVDETAAGCKYITPDHHYLESWNDAEPRPGMFSLVQPTISPIFKTRQFQDSLLTWSDSNTNYYDYLRNYWNNNLYKGETGGFENFWVQVLHDGVYEPQDWATNPLPANEEETAEALPAAIEAGGGGVDFQGDTGKAIAGIRKTYQAGGKVELTLYQKSGIGSGVLANIPWLQELPDPITKATWDNYLCIGISDAKAMGVEQGDIVKVTANGHTVEVPVL
ncbi:MAG: TAT-variant-translocated molybdopterin oxidoreductase, partial [Bacteroidota bacterium]